LTVKLLSFVYIGSTGAVETTIPIITASDVMDTVLVKGLSTTHNESVLKLYFTNKKKSGGGDVTSVILTEAQAYITFVDSNGKRMSTTMWYCGGS